MAFLCALKVCFKLPFCLELCIELFLGIEHLVCIYQFFSNLNKCIFQGEIYKGFAHAYWAFSRLPVTQTLSLMAESDEQQATEVFHLILTYAGLIQTNKGEFQFWQLK